MEMFIGRNDDENNHQPHRRIKEEKQKTKQDISKMSNSRDVELYFFELLEMSYKELQAMLDDYLDLFNTFSDYNYKLNATIIMGAIKTKREREVSAS